MGGGADVCPGPQWISGRAYWVWRPAARPSGPAAVASVKVVYDLVFGVVLVRRLRGHFDDLRGGGFDQAASDGERRRARGSVVRLRSTVVLLGQYGVHPFPLTPVLEAALSAAGRG